MTSSNSNSDAPGADLAKTALDVLADPEQLDTLSETVIALSAHDPDRARAVFDQISGSVEALADQLWSVQATPQANPDAAVVIMAATGKVLAANRPAAHKLKARSGAFADALPFTADSQARLTNQLKTPTADWTILRSTGERGLAASYIALRYSAQNRAPLFIMEMDEGVSDDLAGRIKQVFGLSRSEIEIAQSLSQGLTPVDIARARDRSVETVRVQIKALTAKTETGTQADLVRMLAGIRRVSDVLSYVRSRAVPGQIIATPDGRVIDLVEFGDPKGQPFVFFHGAIAGREPIGALQARLEKDRIRLIVPARPGYGETMAARDAHHHLDRAVADAQTVLEHLGIESPVGVLGYSVGAIMAHEFAARRPERVRGLTLVSPAIPDFDAGAMEHMPIGQRAIAMAASVSPGLIGLLVKMGLQRMNRAGHEGLGRIFFKNAAADQAALEDPQLLHALWRAYLFHSAGGTEAFIHDTILANGGWQPVKQPDCPVQIVHGQADQTVPAGLVRGYAAAQGWPVTLLGGIGHLSLMAAPDAIADALIKQR